MILLFLGSALLGRGLRAGEILRSVFVWIAIALVLVAVYAYREELTGVGGRLLGVLVPGVPIAGSIAGVDDESSVVVARAGAGHFVVRATVEGMPLTMMVDTGASFVTLTTLGYGDFTPVTSVAKSMAILQAVCGVLYLAFLVGRLVGVYAQGKSEG